MYTPHPVFSPPADDTTQIWRYLDFTKLLSLLDFKSLFFARTDKLGDPFEGSWPRLNVDARKEIPADIPADQRDAYLSNMLRLSDILKHWPKCNAISCWHMNEHESAAMWQLYLKSNEGIAIQSTFARLRDAIIDDRSVYIGVVHYINYDTDWFDATNLYWPLLHKRMSFEHERELRAVVSEMPSDDEHGNLDFRKSQIAEGIKVSIDVDQLIENVYIAPDAPQWLADLVGSVATRYQYNFNVVQSKLADEPIY